MKIFAFFNHWKNNPIEICAPTIQIGNATGMMVQESSISTVLAKKGMCAGGDTLAAASCLII